MVQAWAGNTSNNNKTIFMDVVRTHRARVEPFVSRRA
jgi:hypothetical protein